ncbi:hypothetical protein [Spirosoma endophyticum]|nr:hypothetical protein [Spirosoma endophyticum]
MKLTVKNVIDLWFAEDTPIRRYKIKINPKPWQICQQVGQEFKAPSGRTDPTQYRKSDKVAFARLVLAGLAETEVYTEQGLYELA